MPAGPRPARALPGPACQAQPRQASPNQTMPATPERCPAELCPAQPLRTLPRLHAWPGLAVPGRALPLAPNVPSLPHLASQVIPHLALPDLPCHAVPAGRYIPTNDVEECFKMLNLANRLATLARHPGERAPSVQDCLESPRPGRTRALSDWHARLRRTPGFGERPICLDVLHPHRPDQFASLVKSILLGGTSIVPLEPIVQWRVHRPSVVDARSVESVSPLSPESSREVVPQAHPTTSTS